MLALEPLTVSVPLSLSLTVSVPALSSSTMHAKLCARLACEIITPLGSEVDPEVYCKNAKSDATTAAAAEAAAAAGASGARAAPGAFSLSALSA